MLLNYEWMRFAQRRYQEMLEEAARERLRQEWEEAQLGPVARLAERLADALIELGHWLKARYQPAT